MKLSDFAHCNDDTVKVAAIRIHDMPTEKMPVIPTQHEADELVKRFLRELDACQTEQERLLKVWELVHGVVRRARKAEGAL